MHAEVVGWTSLSAKWQVKNVGMFYRQCMLLIDGKYNSDDGLSTGRMCQVGSRSLLGR
jgi:hypothetical protein